MALCWIGVGSAKPSASIDCRTSTRNPSSLKVIYKSKIRCKDTLFFRMIVNKLLNN